MTIWALLLVIFAGLAGAAGVASAAAASHGAAGPDLAIASQFLMLHAAVVLALALAPVAPRVAFLGAGTLILVGLALFAGDLSVRAFGGARLFVMAAPAGGTLLIVGWIAVAIAGIAGLVLRNG